MTLPEGQREMISELYRRVFNPGMRIGDAILQAKSATFDRDVRTTWVLLGDPTTSVR